MPGKALIVTGSDSSHFDLTEDFVVSFREMYQDRYQIAFVNFCTAPVTEVISRNFDVIQYRSNGFETFDKRLGYYVAFNRIKTRLPDLFPGFRRYCWIDSDCWFQNQQSIPRILGFPNNCDICIHPEYDVNYWRHPTPSRRTIAIYQRNEGANFDKMPINMPMLNTGVFAMNSDATLWKRWDAEVCNLVQRFASGDNVFFSDQILLHKIIYSSNARIFPLSAVDNWQTYASLPILHVQRKALCVPTPPFERIGILHLAGNTKDMVLKTPQGFEYTLRYRDMKKLYALTQTNVSEA